MKSTREEVFKYAKDKYGTTPEYLWESAPEYAVLRHADNKKWYAVVMNVKRTRAGLDGDGFVDILNVKLDDPYIIESLLQEKGFFGAYHMSKGKWISILLDGSVKKEEVFALIDRSYFVTASGVRRKKMRGPKEWIIPSNPKYYDIVHAFDDTDTIEWKQGAGINSGDTVFMYVGAPVSAILYKCKVIETDIPYNYKDRNLTIKSVMKIKLERRYGRERFTFKVLKDEYGIFAVRGPRGVTYSLSCELNN